MEYVKNYIFKTIDFLKSNYLYLIWFIIYFTIAWAILGGTGRSFIAVLIIYSISITIALSPLGEWLLKTIENCREPLTEQEQDYLLPLFEEVYHSSKEVYPLLYDGIKIYIIDVMYINAFAIGRKTIAVTKGALETFSADELKGVIAHEFGHLMHGHTKALLLSVIGNFFFTIIVVLFRLIFWVTQIICALVGQGDWSGIIMSIVLAVVRFSVEVNIFIFINLSQIILSLNSRINEFQADTFAYDIGYGRELTGALYLLDKISMGGKLTLSERLKSSHPHTAKRIQNLEQLENEELEELEELQTQQSITP